MRAPPARRAANRSASKPLALASPKAANAEETARATTTAVLAAPVAKESVPQDHAERATVHKALDVRLTVLMGRAARVRERGPGGMMSVRAAQAVAMTVRITRAARGMTARPARNVTVPMGQTAPRAAARVVRWGRDALRVIARQGRAATMTIVHPAHAAMIMPGPLAQYVTMTGARGHAARVTAQVDHVAMQTAHAAQVRDEITIARKAHAGTMTAHEARTVQVVQDPTTTAREVHVEMAPAGTTRTRANIIWIPCARQRNETMTTPVNPDNQPYS